MPIQIYTGKPGNGKTAFLMERLLKEAEKGERPIVAAGINGLEPGLATVLPDPKRWSEITDRTQGPCRCPLIGLDTVDGEGNYPPHTHLIPHGALIFVDEAWKWFGHLHDASRQSTPKWVLDLAEHRHMGVDFVWTAQGPNQIYPFVRPLIAEHTHFVRRFGTHFIDTFEWAELNEEVKSTAKRDLAQRSTRALPKHVFGKYKSAEVHTIKRSIPWKVAILPLIVVAAIVAGYFAYQSLRPSAVAARTMGAGADGLPAAPPTSDGVASARHQEQRPATAAEYAATHLPRFATMPHTAPIFDGRSAVSDPILVCTSTDGGTTAAGEWKGAECQCMSEQGTRYDLPDGECRRVARWGQPYNPYRERVAAPAHDGSLASRDSRQQQPAVAVGIGEVGFPARYGEFRNERQGPRNYELQGW